jgi:hypothetical protein
MKAILDRAGQLTRVGRVLAITGCLLLAATGCNHKRGSGAGAAPSVNAPAVTAVSPAAGPFAGGTTITITGSRFMEAGAGANTVRIGGRLATNVVTVDGTTITATTPTGTPGLEADVEVRNTMGVGRLRQGFRYLLSAAVLSDLNGDGVADMIVGAPRTDTAGTDSGAVFVFFGSDQPGGLTDRTAAQADITIAGQAAGDRFGWTVTAGDLDGDGQDDLVVGAPLHDGAGVDAGAVYMLHGPLTAGVLSASAADVRIVGDGFVPGDRFGASVACGDMDGDGLAEMVIGATRHDVPRTGGPAVDAGCVYVFEGSSMGASMSATQASFTFDGVRAGDFLGNAVACGDVDGDGLADIMMAACLRDAGLPVMADSGEVYVMCSATGFVGRSLMDSDAIFRGEAVRDEFGTTLACGDIDADGFADVIVGTPLNDALGTNVGRVYVFRGEAAMASRSAAAADTFLSGQPTNDAFGFAVTAGDLNGDGYEDVVCGAPTASFTNQGSGRAFVYLGNPGMGDSVATQADVIFNGEPFADDRCGELVRVADVNADGLADMMISAPGNDAGGVSAGRVYVLLGSQGMTGQRGAGQDDVPMTGSEAGGLFGSSVAEGQ